MTHCLRSLKFAKLSAITCRGLCFPTEKLHSKSNFLEEFLESCEEYNTRQHSPNGATSPPRGKCEGLRKLRRHSESSLMYLREMEENNLWHPKEQRNELIRIDQFGRPGMHLHSFDPSLHVSSTCTTAPSIDNAIRVPYLLEDDDLQRNVISHQNYPVTVLYDNYSRFMDQVQSWHRECAPLSEYEKKMILSEDYCSAEQKEPNSPSTNLPNTEQLEFIFQKLSNELPMLFVKIPDFNIYHMKIIFQNNIRGVTTQGLPAYIRQISLFRILGHIKFSYIKFEILKITKHPEDGTVRVRWRIKGIPGYNVLFFWRIHSFYKGKDSENEHEWYDAFSVFHVGSDGKVFKHICDKMIPDENRQPSRTNLAAKLALLLGVIPRPSLEDLNAVLLAFSKLQQSSITSKKCLPTASTPTLS